MKPSVPRPRKPEFNVSSLTLSNHNNEVVWSGKGPSSSKNRVQLDSQYFASRATAEGTITLPAGQFQAQFKISFGQRAILSWTVDILAGRRETDNPDQKKQIDLDCEFILPPTSAGLATSLLPAYAKPICVAGVKAPFEE